MKSIRAVPSSFDAMIMLLLAATAAVAFEDRNRFEISAPQSEQASFAETASSACEAAFAEYQNDEARRTTLMAFGIAAPEQHRLADALASCSKK